MFLKERRGTLNVFYLLESRAKSRATANRTFLLFGDKSYTYADVYDRALRYGTWLRETMGVKEKDIVALDSMNSDTYLFLWFGLWAIGAIPAFINYNLRGEALVHCVKKATTKLMFVDPAVAEALTEEVRGSLSDVRIVMMDEKFEADAIATDPIRYPDEVRYINRGEEIAILIYTSGTTGLPKAAVVSWAKVIVAGGFVPVWAGLRPTDIFYTVSSAPGPHSVIQLTDLAAQCMPVYHSSATLICISASLNIGCTVALGVRFSNKTFWSEVRGYNATVIQYVGETCRYLLAAPPEIDTVTGDSLDKKHNVRLAVGNGLRPDVWNRFKERFGIESIAEFYGATEGSFSTYNYSSNDFAMGAVGRGGWLYRSTVGRRARIVTVDHATDRPYRDPKTGFCQDAKVDEPGEMLCILPQETEKHFQGYFGDKKATSSKIMRDVFKKGDAWFRTGDLLRQDSEGRMFFVDRLGDTFRWKSENVSTTEVAHVVGLHPEVQDANVYGVQLPHHDGRVGCVALALNGTPNEAALSSLAKHVQAGLPRYAVPLFLRIMKGTGTHATGTNKHQKHLLRAQGVSPHNVEGDDMYWLKDGTYERFGHDEWARLNGGMVKL